MKKRGLANHKKYKDLTEQLKGNHRLTLSQRWADVVTKFVGSWIFILLLVLFLVSYVSINIIILIEGWDPYPFVFLNLLLACITALQAPIILMSQNRQTERDRLKTERDHLINLKEEKEIEDVQRSLNQIKKLLNSKSLRK